MTFVTFIWHVFLISIIVLIYMVGVLVIIGLILGVLQKRSQIYLTRTFGKNGNLITAWLGTPIHEIGHWIQCIIWRHQVESVKLLQLNDPNGILGYVKHKYNPKSIYQQIGNFFIGIGPIISGLGTIVLAMYLLVPQSIDTLQNQIQQSTAVGQKLDIHILYVLVDSVLAMSQALLTTENFTKTTFWLFIVIAICISSHIALSLADIQSSFQGLLTIFTILILINLVAGLFDIDTYQMILKFTAYNAYLLAFSSIAVMFSLISFLFSFCLYKLLRS